jgi:2-polyprenyl-6-hydroxyphenyl methylase/3-demethylubiquinone-9 3-methyltransferase
MAGYYSRHLSGTRLKEVYDLASPRIRQYLQAEIDHVIDLVTARDRILELGCGYGRALKEIAPHVSRAVGADVSRATVESATLYLREVVNVDLVRMDAARTAFCENSFDAVICIQNGISAFGVDRSTLLAEAIRLARPGGLVLFSTYSPKIWEARLDWFRAQSAAGLVGELDEPRCRAGTIVCKDGFQSFTVSGEEFSELVYGIGQTPRVNEIDGSSVFVEVVKKPRGTDGGKPMPVTP